MNETEPQEPTVFTSVPSQHHGQFLMEEWPDGRRTIAWRAAAWETWTPPVDVVAVPVYKAAM